MTEMLDVGTIELPPDIITQTLALLAIRGAGKSTAGADLVEEMYRLGLPFVVVDPKGDWWGIRSAADGKGPGLPIPVFGGLHGDLPLTPDAGPLIAELISGHNLTCIVDVSDFDSDGQRLRFLTEFGLALFRRHRHNPAPRMVVLEEADEVVPQMVTADKAPCVGIWTKIAKQGRSFGLGLILISQRSAAVNKNALSQVETLIAMRTTDPRDVKAIGDWIRSHDAGGELLESLGGLGDGQAWLVSRQWLASRHGMPAVQKIQFRRRRTFDSGATPVMGQAPRTPATLADIDLAAVAAQMAEVTERVQENDPAALHRQVRDLRDELAGLRRLEADHGRPRRIRPAQDAAVNTELTAANETLRGQVQTLRAELAEARDRPPQVHVVEVPALQAGEAAAVDQVITALRDLSGQLGGHAAGLAAALDAASRPPAAAVPRRRPVPPAVGEAGGDDEPAGDEDTPLRRGERMMLSVMVRMRPLRLTQTQLGTLAGFAPGGGTFGNYLRTLKRRGLAVTDGKEVDVTPAGIAVVPAGDLAPLTAAGIRQLWAGVLRAGERAMLDILIDRYPGTVTRDELAALTGFEVSGGTFGNYLRTLKRNGLAVETGGEIRAADVFFLNPAEV